MIAAARATGWDFDASSAEWHDAVCRAWMRRVAGRWPVPVWRGRSCSRIAGLQREVYSNCAALNIRSSSREEREKYFKIITSHPDFPSACPTCFEVGDGIDRINISGGVTRSMGLALGSGGHCNPRRNTCWWTGLPVKSAAVPNTTTAGARGIWPAVIRSRRGDRCAKVTRGPFMQITTGCTRG